MIHTFLYISLHVIRHLCMKCSKHELVLTMNVRNSLNMQVHQRVSLSFLSQNRIRNKSAYKRLFSVEMYEYLLMCN